jgi:hypothetical protein
LDPGPAGKENGGLFESNKYKGGFRSRAEKKATPGDEPGVVRVGQR